jgi:outer membrane protein assembly factor BamB
MCCIILFLLTYPIIGVSKQIEIKKEKSTLSNPPMDSPWPMYGHDVRHTGRSPYSTVYTREEIWRFKMSGGESSPVIDKDGTIYTGIYDFYAIYQNGTLKWKYDTKGVILSTAAIDENGIIYVGNAHGDCNLYAFYPNGTLKWKFWVGESIFSSPAIGDDGTIYFGDANHRINAIYPNGTLRWRYKTGHVVYSSPAIGDDGTVYCGSHDTYLYALYPNNGTLKWKFKTGNWVHGSPSIGADGTVYFGSDDNYLYALSPNNGTMKWRCGVGAMDAAPAIDKNGILYFGVWQEKFLAVYPNGTIKWIFHLGKYNGMWGSTAAISNEGTIYFGMCYDMGHGNTGDIIALFSDGSVKWRKSIGRCHSSPAIGEDGTVYTQSMNGYLYAFGRLDPNAPSAPDIDGPPKGKPGIEYEFTFNATDPNGDDVKYHIEWDDGNTETTNFSPSGTDVQVKHTWNKKGTYIIKATAEDTTGLVGPEGTLTVIIPRTRATSYLWFQWFLERFPILSRLLYLIE